MRVRWASFFEFEAKRERETMIGARLRVEVGPWTDDLEDDEPIGLD